MASARCPHCGDSYVGLPDKFNDRLQCQRCGKHFIVEMKDGRARTVTSATLIIDAPAKLDTDIATDLQEACGCFNIGAYRASVVMARRFLEALLDRQGFKARTLVERLKRAHESGAVSDLTFQLATSTRMLGNYGAHYSDDQLTQIGQDEAELVLNMVRQILKSMFR